MDQIINLISEANPTRTFENIGRRVIKLGEEYGEVSEAYLNVSSASNGKGMTWADVREELCDTMIVAVDVALTVLEGERARPQDIKADLIAFIGKPLPFPLPRETFMLQLQSGIGKLADLLVEDAKHDKVRAQAFELVKIAYTAARQMLPDQNGVPWQMIDTNLHTEVVRKLAKWKNNRDTGKVATDAE